MLEYNSSGLEDTNFTNLFVTGSSDRQKFVTDRIHLVLLYIIIFLMSVSGNVLVIITLMVNQRMRTVTNVFLFNLAISDLLLGVFCMPFTLTGVLLRQFVFGSILCRLIPYFQAVSVSVSAWTLVAMSVERYFAICHPLKSRKWQTLSHAYKTIAIVWFGSLICMLPILLLSQLQKVKGTGRYKCRENWPRDRDEKVFTIFLDIVLLLLPLIMMSATYSLIIRTLWRAMDIPGENTAGCKEKTVRKESPNLATCPVAYPTLAPMSSPPVSLTMSTRNHHPVRRSNFERSIVQKKRIIKMLFVVVLEFFICWTPLYTINTITLFNPNSVYSAMGYSGIGFFQLLAYTSSCCNPVTYCFMNSRFRQSCFGIFPCVKKRRDFRSNMLADERTANNTQYKSRLGGFYPMCMTFSDSRHCYPRTPRHNGGTPQLLDELGDLPSEYTFQAEDPLPREIRAC